MKIFVASTGRCGTRFMTWVFRHYTTVSAFHEPDPKLFLTDAEGLNAGAIGRDTSQRILRKFRWIETMAKNGDYFESSNMFIKSWADAAAARWEGEIGIVYLRRDLAGYLASFTRRGKRGKKGRFESAFLLDPTAPGNRMPGFEGMSYYEIVAWNYFEAQARFLEMKKTGIPTFELEFKDINSIPIWKELFSTFGIEHRLPPKFPDNADRHQSIFDDESRLLALQHLKENWTEPLAEISPENKNRLLEIPK